MDNINKSTGKRAVNRALSLLLALCLALSLVPALPGTAWAAPAEDTDSDDLVKDSLDTLVEWGVMRGDTDGGLYPDRSLTRAEFTAMVNRAYGYDAAGETPFTDVDEKAWYADDIAIAYNTGYFNGTGPTTASPNRSLTREEALILLTRSLRLEEVPGQVVELADGDQVSNWARGYVRAAAQAGLIDDEAGKGFRPTDTMTRGEMAALLTRSVGTLVQDGGEQSLGDVFGNVTVNKAGTTLKDTVIAGDLYITGGLGLGAVTLENTTVLGKIVVAGGGVSEKGEDSVILRNVEAENLVVDSIRNQYNSVRAEGDTSIQNATLRTSAFVQDRSQDGFGLLNLTLDGRGPEMSFTVSGNLKDVVNKTPGSTLTVSDGAAQQLTIDEAATDSALTIERGGLVHKLNLDATLEVTGEGDVQSLQVSAPDSKVEMLPEQITIRPGLTANIFGQDMDNQQAHESSSSPRFLAGYPKMKNIASKTATAVFATNKPGTVYWALSAQTDGSISEEHLLNPGAYGNRAILQGNVDIAAATEEVQAAIRSLDADGSYYLSAIFVDGRGNRSPIKVVAFGTPDDSVPAFVKGYPQLVRIGIGTGTGTKPSEYPTQVLAMTTKNCVLYYALFPAGAKAPTVNDFRNNSLNGNLGSGSLTIIRNDPEPINVNHVVLTEKTDYIVYFWLNDIDGAKSSSVTSLRFTTPDCTNPKFVTDPFVTKTQATSVTATGMIDEAGKIYWVAVKTGAQYPKAPSGTTVNYKDEKEFGEFLKTDYAKIQVENAGGSPLKNGSVNAQGNKDFNLTVSGLTAQTAYDIYYVAKDSAGNYSESVQRLTVNTEDNVAPTATLRFNKFANNDASTPFANTDIDIVFSERVRANNEANGDLIALYNAVETAQAEKDAAKIWQAKQNLADVLSKIIKLYDITGTNLAAEVTAREHDQNTGAVTSPADGGDWTIDYYNAQVYMDDTDPEGRRMIVSFKNNGNELDGAVKLKSGSTYYFELSGITDTSSAENLMGTTRLPKDSAGRDSEFTTISAQMIFDGLNLLEDITYVIDHADGTAPTPGTKTLPVDEFDMAFTMIPRSTDSVEDNINWEMLFWSDTSVKFELFYKLPGENEVWHKAPNEAECIVPEGTTSHGATLHRGLRGLRVNPLLANLEAEQPYQFVIHFTEVGGSGTRDDWSKDVNFTIQAVAGSNHDIGTQNEKMLNGVIIDPLKPPIGSFSIGKSFHDKNPPTFTQGYPSFDIADTKGTIRVQTNRPAVVYWTIAPEGEVTTKYMKKNADGTETEEDVDFGDSNIPHMSEVLTGKPELVAGPNNAKADPEKPFVLTVPNRFDITEPNFSNPAIQSGRLTVGSGAMDIPLKNLTPNTNYFAYFVLQGPDGGAMSEKVMLYKFKTLETIRPIIELDVSNPTVYISSNIDADVDHMLVRYTANTLNSLLTQKFEDVIDPKYIKKDQATGKPVAATDSRLTYEYVEPLQGLLKAAMDKNAADMELFGSKDKPKFTVLMAMATDVQTGSNGASKGCLFDQYAKYDAQQDVAGYIRATTAGSTDQVLEPQHDVRVTADKRKEVKCGDYALGETARYAFLAIGRTPGSGDDEETTSGWSFRAYYPIYKSDEAAPRITSITGDLKPGTDSATGKPAITGNIYVVFDENLYYNDSDETKFYQLDLGPTTGVTRTGNWESVGAITSTTSPTACSVVTTKGKEGKATSSVQIYLRNIQSGVSPSVTFASGLSDKASNDWGTITLTFEYKEERVPAPTADNPNATTTVPYVQVSAPKGLLADGVTVTDSIRIKQ